MTLATYAYDDLGRRTGVTRGNGAASTYGFDDVSRLTSLVNNVSGSTNDVAWGFDHNPAGQIVDRTVSNAAYAFTPADGTTAYANNGRNQVTSAGSAAVSYDARQNIAAIGGAAYGYNAWSQLVSGAGSAMTYDPAGRLYSMSGTDAGRFQYDGVQLATVYDPSSLTVTERYVAGPGPDEWVVIYSGAGTTTPSYPMQDAQGSVVALTNASAAATSINAYDEYGVPKSGNAGRMQYTGQMWLPQAGLYHYKARAYAPQLGRFLQTDPIGYAAGANLYAYVGGDPVNWIDPRGEARHYYECIVASINEWIDGEQVVTGIKGTCFVDIPDPYPTGNRDASGGGHGFEVVIQVCSASSAVDPQQRSEGLRRTPFPGWNKQRLVPNGSRNFVHGRLMPFGLGRIPGGWVITTFQDGVLFNDTTDEHFLRGQTERGYATGSNGALFSYAVGRGDSPVFGMDAVNDLVGPLVFGEVLSDHAAWVRQNVEGC